MTVNGIEMALYDLGVKREARAAFQQDADGFLKRYRLDDEERTQLKAFDVAALQRRGASALLTLGFWMTNAPNKSRAAYLDCLRIPPSGESRG
jgi:protocatechuate 4,5-dioxygenase alpha chain